MNYLKQILKKQDFDPSDHLKRYGIVDKVRNKYRVEYSIDKTANVDL